MIIHRNNSFNQRVLPATGLYAMVVFFFVSVLFHANICLAQKLSCAAVLSSEGDEEVRTAFGVDDPEQNPSLTQSDPSDNDIDSIDAVNGIDGYAVADDKTGTQSFFSRFKNFFSISATQNRSGSRYYERIPRDAYLARIKHDIPKNAIPIFPNKTPADRAMISISKAKNVEVCQFRIYDNQGNLIVASDIGLGPNDHGIMFATLEIAYKQVMNRLAASGFAARGTVFVFTHTHPRSGSGFFSNLDHQSGLEFRHRAALMGATFRNSLLYNSGNPLSLWRWGLVSYSFDPISPIRH